jgi:ABC-2 type transport system permease protein
MIWVALLGSGARFDTSLREMVTFLIITSIVVSLTASSAGDEIAEKIRDGSIAADLIKPVNLKTLLFFNDLGDNIFKTLVGFLPIGIIVVLGFGFLPPTGIAHFLAFLIVLVLGAALQFYYNYILGLFTFWLISNPFLRWHFKNVTQLFSGQLLPIWLYPAWLAQITVFLPFRYFSYEPIALYLGRSPLESLPQTLLIMSVWLFILYAIERILWHFAIKKLVIQGG